MLLNTLGLLTAIQAKQVILYIVVAGVQFIVQVEAEREYWI